jgi:hypothetical protein
MDAYAPYHVELIKIADRLTSREGQSETDYLRRFRTIYRHLAASVTAVSIESGMGMAMGMPPGFTAPDASRLLEGTEKELEGLG